MKSVTRTVVPPAEKARPPEWTTRPAAVCGFRFIDVSVEPEDGDPAHSGRSVLRAAAT